MSTIEELRKEADDLGITYGKTLGAEKLAAKIEEHYVSLETSGAVVEEKVKAKEAKEAKVQTGRTLTPAEQKRIEREKEAKKTRVVIITDNDQRVNSKVNTCIASCGNAYFDLGTRVIPLNEKVEVRMGHILSLKEVEIPLHIEKQNGSSMGSVRMVKRYNVSFED